VPASLSRTGAKSGGANPYASTLGNAGAYDPSYLQSAYNLPFWYAGSTPSAGSGQTVAVVDAYDDPNAASDLASYRSYFGLPTANFQKVNQTGGTSYPRVDSGWAQEISLDLDMVSAICPNCSILLVEANSSSFSDLGAAMNYAAAHANAVSNSYGGSDSSSDATYDSLYYKHAGIAVTVSSGDNGYGVEYPAASQYVTAVGGTSLQQATNTGSRSATETVWSGAGSGCSAYETKPTWQKDAYCAKRTVADTSAVADPNTGVWVRYNSAWYIFGGTSVASPIIASVYALNGAPAAGTYPGSYPYAANSSNLNDITSGSNGACSPAGLCTGEPGYDGPTGLGTPNTDGAFSYVAPSPPAPPAVTSISPTSGSSLGGTSVTVNGTGLTGAAAVNFGANPGTNLKVVSDSQLTATSPAGSGTVNVTVTTSAGTSTAVQADQFIYTAPPAPAVSSLSPASGSSLGATTVTVNGSGFTGATAVTFGANAGTNLKVVPDSQLPVPPPAGSGTVDVTVTTPAGASQLASGDKFTYVTAPVVGTITPTSGPAAGGTALTVNGSGFTGATSVSFGATAGTNLTVVSDSQITVTSPSGSGVVDVTVTTAGGTSAVVSGDKFTYVSPTFTMSAASSSITVSRGTTSSPDTITLTTTNGYSPNATFSISGLPKHTSAPFNPNPATWATGATTTSSALTITPSRAAPAGTYLLTVSATGTSQTLSITLTIQ